MPKFAVELSKSAQKEFQGLPDRIRNKIVDALTLIAANPFTELLPIKKLRGADSLYRIRLGDYRVVYELRREVLVVLVIKIGHRSEVYRGL